MARDTKTGGRPATTGVIGGGTALAVGRPTTATPDSFTWTELISVARLETGHTPSRKHPEYWDGDIPWIGIKDATANHGRTIHSTNQAVTALGIENSAARVLPEHTVCLSRTASIGYVVVMGRPMATSQDFVNWVCGPDIDHRYLKYVLQLERETLLRFAHGTTHQTIYFPEVKAFHVLLPRLEEQRAVADVLGALDDKIEVNRRCAHGAEALLDLLSSASAESSTVLGDISLVDRAQCDPAAKGDSGVDHFSIPAFDGRRLPERTPGSMIKSSKFEVPGERILVSRLNPRTNRTWFAVPTAGVLAAASTEFLVMRPAAGVALGGLWLAVRSETFRDELARRATGTSGSHQRVRPDDALSMEVPDAREIAAEVASEAEALLRVAHHARIESETLAELRDTLLPELLSGRMRVEPAEELVEAAGA